MIDKTALIIIDVQNGLFSIEGFPIYKEDVLIKNLQLLIKKARKANIQIFYVQHNDPKGEILENGTEKWKIRPEISPESEDIIIQKHNPDSFLNTPLNEELHKHKITRLVIAGLATDMCIDTTVRSAVSHNYKVILIQDAHSTMDSEVLKASKILAHHNNILQWFADLKKTEDLEFN
ncbi:MAG: cysteine hydrolase family protein [Promethearchaeota archaeon]